MKKLIKNVAKKMSKKQVGGYVLADPTLQTSTVIETQDSGSVTNTVMLVFLGLFMTGFLGFVISWYFFSKTEGEPENEGDSEKNKIETELRGSEKKWMNLI